MEGHEKDQDGKWGLPPQAQAWESTNTVFTNEKAGMKGVDKDKIKKVIYEMSKVGLTTISFKQALPKPPCCTSKYS